MARFDVYPNSTIKERSLIPYFLDVQNDHIQGLQTRILVPLWNAKVLPLRVADLNPEFEIEGHRVVMDTPSLGAVPVSALKPAVDNLAPQQLVIQNALDVLFGGF